MATSYDPSGLWALAPFVPKAIDRQNLVIIRKDTGAVAALDARWQPFLQRMQVFRTLAGHARAIAAATTSLKGQERQLEQALAALLPLGVFVSADELVVELRAGFDQSATLAPVTVCIKTCDRPRTLERLLDSIRENLDAYGNAWRCEVFDDSRDDDNAKANISVVEKASRDFPVFYIGRADQQQLLQKLCSEFPQDSPHFRWLLAHDHSGHQGKATYGLITNHIFLRHAGRRVIMVDDDSVMRGWVWPRVEWVPRFGGSTGIEELLSEEDAAFTKLEPYRQDVFASHSSVLGAGIGEAISAISGGKISARCMAESAHSEVQNLKPATSRVRYTLNGLVGDTGTEGDYGLLSRGGNTLARIAVDEGRYRQFRASPRSVITVKREPALLNSDYFHLTTCAGLDLNGYMAPMVPTGRGEDTLIGILFRYLYPDDFGLRLPFGLEHYPVEPRRWNFEPWTGSALPTASSALATWIRAISVSADVGPRQRIRILGESIERAARSGELNTLLRNYLHRNLHFLLADEIASNVKALTENAHYCPLWRHDVKTIKDWASKELRSMTPYDDHQLTELVDAIRRYGEILPAWERAYAYCSQSELSWSE